VSPATTQSKQTALEQGISAAKTGNKPLARRHLLQAVEAEPQTEACWLWLAIVAASMEEQVGYLQQARVINPTNQRTIAALQQLEAKLGQELRSEHTEDVAQATVSVNCPLCTATMAEKMDICPGCGAILVLDDITAVLDHTVTHPDILKKSILRLRSEADKGGDRADILYKMGLAYLNLHKVETAVTCFNGASRLQPDDLILKQQIERLVNHQKAAAPPPAPPKVAPTPPVKKATKPIQTAPSPAVKATAETPVKKVKPPVKKEEPSLGTIMIVDDSNTIRKLVDMTLKRERYATVIAVDGMDALAKLNDAMPDLILLDITMPRMDGYQVCKVVKGNEETKNIPVVMLSGKDGFFDKVRGRVAGATDYLTKPFDPQELVQTVKRHMEKRA
jgi:twitching motility two-component system response regulator PilG